MRDSEVVASIVAGDPDGLAEAYDRYANALFGYCRTLLREPADAADAVQDTFVIAASRLSGLRDPDLLRPWLFAVARNECLRRLKTREAASALDDDAEQADESVDVGGEAERAETRALLRAAVDGLNPAERDVITAMLHGLDIAEIALVLGVSRNHVHSLFSRARQQLEASVAALIVARSGRQDCQTLDTMLTGWDGRLTVPLRRQIGKHIEKCPVCSGRRRRELTPALLLGLSPGALAGVLAARRGRWAGRVRLRAAAAAAVAHGAAPAALRDQVLRMATGKDLHSQAYQSALVRSHGPFGENGFPKPLRAGHHVLPRVPHPRLAAAAAGAAVVAAAVILATLAGGHRVQFSSGGPLPGGQPRPSRRGAPRRGPPRARAAGAGGAAGGPRLGARRPPAPPVAAGRASRRRRAARGAARGAHRPRRRAGRRRRRPLVRLPRCRRPAPLPRRRGRRGPAGPPRHPPRHPARAPHRHPARAPLRRTLARPRRPRRPAR